MGQETGRFWQVVPKEMVSRLPQPLGYSGQKSGRECACLYLYGDRRSGNCLKIVYAADWLGLDCTFVDIDIMTGGSRTPDFLAVNPAVRKNRIVLVALE